MKIEPEAATHLLSSPSNIDVCGTGDMFQQQLFLKTETSPRSLQIDCRANNSQPDLYQAFHTEVQSSSTDHSHHAQPGCRRNDRMSGHSQEEKHQPTSSHESSRPLECMGPGPVQAYDKVCPG